MARTNAREKRENEEGFLIGLQVDVNDVHTVEIYKVCLSHHWITRWRRYTQTHARTTSLTPWRSHACHVRRQTPGFPRVGIVLQQPKKGPITVASVLPDGPAAGRVTQGEVVIAVNGVPVHDAVVAQQKIVAATGQSTSTGRLLPVRLTLGTLALPCLPERSPKGIADLRLDGGLRRRGRHESRQARACGGGEAVQSL